MKFAEFNQSDYEIHNLTKLDGILVKLCKMLIDYRKKDREYYGMVAAAVLDPDNNLVAKVNFPREGLRVHAERAAMEEYVKKYGDIPEGSIILTTLSPCSELHDVTADNRYGESCTKLINDSIVRKVYCGYMDPSQGDDQHEERDFTLQETNNGDIRELCKKFADTFLKDKKANEFVLELHLQPEVDEGWKDWAVGAAIGATALGPGAAKATVPQQNYQNDPINKMVQQKEADKLNAIDRAKLQDILKLMQADKDAEIAQQPKPQLSPAAQADPTKNLKPGATKSDFTIPGTVKPKIKMPARPVTKPAAAIYKPITGRSAETALYNFAVKMGLKGTELAAFMGQSAHESDGFKTAEEYASGDAYEGRKDLGNIHKGDGRKYKGRGFIQITGRYNYTEAGKALGLDLVNHPELAEKPVNAAKVTWWYWKNKVRPHIGNFDNTKAVTKKIQGGSLGLKSREKYTQSFKLAQK